MNDRAKYWAALEQQRREREIASATPVPYRITTALDMCNLYGPEVDRALGGEEPMVDLWEEGKLIPTPEQIKALADLTGYPVHYFYMPVHEGEGGYAWFCTRSGPDKGCERAWIGPPPKEAQVLHFPGTPPTRREHP